MVLPPNFLQQAPPENYVAGLGRGATGFTTRSDLGPAPSGITDDQIKEKLAKRAAALGTEAPSAYGIEKRKEPEDEDDQERFRDAEDEHGLLGAGNFDQEDDEADRIYQAVDERMGKRRKKQREARETAEREEYERNNPKIQQQFADLKRQLAHVTDEEWANIPAVGDRTGKNRRNNQKDRERHYAVPDSVIAGAIAGSQLGTEIQDDGAATAGGRTTGNMTNFKDIGDQQKKVLSVRLDQAAGSEDGSQTSLGTGTSFDTKGYLTSLGVSEQRAEDVPVGDVKRTRVLMDSVIRANPRHGPAWIAAARLEEFAGKIVAARNKIRQGCEMCPKNEDTWMECIRLHDNENAKIMAAKALSHIDQSVPLWKEAMNLETLPLAKRRVMRKALDANPNSEELWKEAVNLEPERDDAKLLLAKAVHFIPESVDLVLALARLESPREAEIILNAASKKIPTSHDIWIAAVRLQEQQGKPVGNKMKAVVRNLKKHNTSLKREEWIAQAEKCEKEGDMEVCRGIIDAALGDSLDEDDDREGIWMADAKASATRACYGTARAIYDYALRIFPEEERIWLAAIELKREHGTQQEVLEALRESTQACKDSEKLWIQLAQTEWESGFKDEAYGHISSALHLNSGLENLFFQAVQMSVADGDLDRARSFLEAAMQNAISDRVFIKAAVFERQLGNIDAALAHVNEGLQTRFDASPKLWMMKGQLYEMKEMDPQAREAFSTGTRKCPQSVPLWLLLSRIEERMGAVVKARSVLDRARLAVANSAELWLESVRLELRAKNVQAATSKMAQAQRECPKSGLLWSLRIWNLEPRTHRKPRIVEAMRDTGDDPVLFVTAARVFWADRKLEKADSWFDKATILDPDYGDTWAWYYLFLRQHGLDEKIAKVVAKCVKSAPKHGEAWQSISKAPENYGLGTAAVLHKVAKMLDAQ